MNDTSVLEQPPESAAVEEGWEWMVVEIMGHRKHAGRVREVERFGAKQLRIDVPIKGDPANGWETYHYSGSAIFGYMLTDEATVMKANKPYEPSHRLTYREQEPEVDDGAPFDDEDEPGDDGGEFDANVVEPGDCVTSEEEWKNFFVAHLVALLQGAGVTVDPSLAAEHTAADKSWSEREDGSTPAFSAQIYFDGLMEDQED